MKANNYSIVPGAKFDGKGQAALVFEILAAKSEPTSVSTIAAELDADPRFKTRQTPLRIAAYYVCVFKKAGIVSASAAEVELATNEHENETVELDGPDAE